MYLNSIIVKGVYYKSKNKQGTYGTSTIGEVTVYGKASRNSGEYDHIR